MVESMLIQMAQSGQIQGKVLIKIAFQRTDIHVQLASTLGLFPAVLRKGPWPKLATAKIVFQQF